MEDPTLKALTCPRCATPSAPGESYCRNCGNALIPPTVAAQTPTIPAPPAQAAPPFTPAAQPAAPAYPSQPAAPVRKRRSPLLMGCLIFLCVLVALGAIGGIYVWRQTTYTPPTRQAPDLPERAAGTITEFPVDNDPNAPARPTSVETETLSATASAKSTSASQAKLPPGIDRAKLSKGATAMTSSVYRRRPKSGDTSTTSARDEIYICVLKATPNSTAFVDELATSAMRSMGGQRSGVRV
ncbi:MAG TPA: hypothetical protein VF507_07615, partial [Pyrinomonadaceae bacterium]